MATHLAQVQRSCPACRRPNRIPARHLADRGRCGACKATLEPAAMPFDVGAAEFEEITGGAQVPVLVDFWAEWCGPCRMAKPHVDRLAQELSGQALVLKVDTEREPNLAARYGVRALPTFMVFLRGQPVAQQAGLGTPAQLRRMVEQAASSS